MKDNPEPPGGNASETNALPDIQLLSARTGQLVEMIRAAGARLDELCCRPQVVLQQARAQSTQLSALNQEAAALSAQLELKIGAAKDLNKSMESRTAALQDVLNLTEAATRGLMERVGRAQQLAEHFNSQVEEIGRRMQGFETLIGQAGSAGKAAGQQTSAAEKAAAEAAQAASQAAQAARQLNELGAQWHSGAASLAAEQRKLIDASRTAAGELQLLIGQATRLEEAFRREAGSLGAMLDRAAAERQTWSAFLGKLPRRARRAVASTPQVPGSRRPPGGSADARQGAMAFSTTAEQPGVLTPPGPCGDAGAPAALAARIRRLAGLVRQAGAAASQCPGAGKDKPVPDSVASS